MKTTFLPSPDSPWTVDVRNDVYRLPRLLIVTHHPWLQRKDAPPPRPTGRPLSSHLGLIRNPTTDRRMAIITTFCPFLPLLARVQKEEGINRSIKVTPYISDWCTHGWSGGGVEGKAFDSKLERSGLILAILSDLSTKVVQSRWGGIDSC